MNTSVDRDEFVFLRLSQERMSIKAPRFAQLGWYGEMQ